MLRESRASTSNCLIASGHAPPAVRGTTAGAEFFVVARLADDMAYAFSDWGEGISPWRFNVPTAHYEGPYVAHAVLDRSLFRAGDTASMKVFVRKQTGAGFATVPRKDLDDKLLIRHQGSEREYTVPIHWNGSAHGEASFAIPKDALLGTYTITMNDSLVPPRHRYRNARTVGRFRVEAFRVPLMRARLQPVGTPLINPDDVSIDMTVNYLAGGGAGGLAVKLRTQLETKSVAFPDFEGYAFAAGDVKRRPQRGRRVDRAFRRIHLRRSRQRRRRRGQRGLETGARQDQRALAFARRRGRRARDRQEYRQGRRRPGDAARSGRRARIPRSQRRDADRRDAGCDLARTRGAGHQARQLGSVERQAQVHGGRGRRSGPTAGRRSRPDRRLPAR